MLVLAAELAWSRLAFLPISHNSGVLTFAIYATYCLPVTSLRRKSAFVTAVAEGNGPLLRVAVFQKFSARVAVNVSRHDFLTLFC